MYIRLCTVVCLKDWVKIKLTQNLRLLWMNEFPFFFGNHHWSIIITYLLTFYILFEKYQINWQERKSFLKLFGSFEKLSRVIFHLQFFLSFDYIIPAHGRYICKYRRNIYYAWGLSEWMKESKLMNRGRSTLCKPPFSLLFLGCPNRMCKVDSNLNVIEQRDTRYTLAG